ncbi:hypothetical protein OAR79_06810 [Candidatus Thioglobus sp.]|nr:hypothetical protein [Candidatus Thioglobus sp.]
MQKLLILLILSLFSTQGLAASCPDGNEPIKTVSADGSYYVYKCGLSVLEAPKAEFYQRQYDMNSKVDQILSNRKTINPFLAWNYSKAFSDNYYGIAWTGGKKKTDRLFPDNMLEFHEIYWNYYYVGSSWSYWKDHAKQQTFVTSIDWDHDAEYGVTKAMNVTNPAYPQAFADEVHAISEDGFHGVMLDWWHIHHPIPWRGTKLENAMIRITDEIRKQAGGDFLIFGNTNDNKNPNLLKPINGVFLELTKNPQDSFTFAEIAEMEEVIKFNEKHLRYPKLIAFEPWRITDKSDPYNRTSEGNLRFARLYSAMTTVIPEHGYILYADNNPDFDDGDHDHHYYDVYSVDLGKPVSKYTPIAKGVAYKKFEDGYIAFNRLEYDVTVNFGDFEVIIPSMDAVFLKEDGTPYVGCEEGFIKKDGVCTVDDSPLFSEDFENGSRVKDNEWTIKQDNDGNSIYCNKVTGDWANFKFGSDDWTNYSISLRMKFPDGKTGDAETYIRVNPSFRGYRVNISNIIGKASSIAFYSPYDRITSAHVPIKRDGWMQVKLIFNDNNLKFFLDDKFVDEINDDRRKNGSGGFGASPNSEVCVDDIVVNKI